MPARFVSDPSVELGDIPSLSQLVTMIEVEHGDAAVTKLDTIVAKALSAFAIYGRSYVLATLGGEKDSASLPAVEETPLQSFVQYLFPQVSGAGRK
jgi:hypothetical protein